MSGFAIIFASLGAISRYVIDDLVAKVGGQDDGNKGENGAGGLLRRM